MNISTGVGLPISIMLPYAGDQDPAGWLVCDGRTVSRTEYSRLFQIIGTKYGAGDGVSTFHIPDYRGRFPRGADNGAGRDPDAASRTASNAGGATGDNVGSIQDDAMQPITGNVEIRSMQGNGTVGSLTRTAAGTQEYAGSGNGGVRTLTLNSANQTRTSSETRPVNINSNFIIKY